MYAHNETCQLIVSSSQPARKVDENTRDQENCGGVTWSIAQLRFAAASIIVSCALTPSPPLRVRISCHLARLAAVQKQALTRVRAGAGATQTCGSCTESTRQACYRRKLSFVNETDLNARCPGTCTKGYGHRHYDACSGGGIRT